jgi:uncharacterized protein YndB with AHSA1/START domain
MSVREQSNEIRITRVYDAPVSRVWDAWADVEQAAHWWGPRGFTITTHSKDLRSGGSWSYTMHGPDGKDWPNFARYHDVQPYTRLVYDHGATAEDAQPLFRVTVTFRDLGAGTELDIVMALATPEAAAQTREFIKAAGGNGTWDRLAEYLEKVESAEEVFVINRSFDVPINTMYELWTNPTHLAAWLPPAGCTMEFRRADIRTGGDAFYAMTNGDFTMFGRFNFLDLQPPERLQYTQVFTDEAENITRHPGSALWPEAMLTTVTFAQEGPTQTRVTVRWAAFGAATNAEVAAFVAERAGMAQGWTGSFDKLESMITRAAGQS